MSEIKSLGQIAYEAYSSVRDIDMLPWEVLYTNIQESWNHAANAVTKKSKTISTKTRAAIRYRDIKPLDDAFIAEFLSYGVMNTDGSKEHTPISSRETSAATEW